MANDKLTDALEWAMTVLKQTKINTEIVVQTPWSSVVRVNTGNEYFHALVLYQPKSALASYCSSMRALLIFGIQFNPLHYGSLLMTLSTTN